MQTITAAGTVDLPAGTYEEIVLLNSSQNASGDGGLEVAYSGELSPSVQPVPEPAGTRIALVALLAALLVMKLGRELGGRLD
jgi:hypothetical protein